MNKLLLTLFTLITCICIQAQDTLPKFSVRNIGNKRIIVDWVNTFEVTKQISVQRSFDSLKNFKTVLTVPDPTNPQNGYADTKADNDHMFYRLYILLDNGVYLFSASKRATWDTTVKRMNDLVDKSPVIIPVIPGDNSSKGDGISSNKPRVAGVDAFKIRLHL